jgi:hypothetical protein
LGPGRGRTVFERAYQEVTAAVGEIATAIEDETA